MHCQHCGKQIERPAAQYCHRCGSHLDRAIEVSEAASPAETSPVAIKPLSPKQPAPAPIYALLARVRQLPPAAQSAALSEMARQITILNSSVASTDRESNLASTVHRDSATSLPVARKTLDLFD
jgi:hypothetical protein